MGDNTLSARTNGQTIDQTWFNDIHTALQETVLGRNSSGVPTAGKDLGSNLYPWGTVYAGDLVIDGSLVDLESVLATASHKVVSGKVHTDANQPCFLTPAGSGRSLTIAASVTPLVYEVSGEVITLSSDIVVSGLTAAPSSNNTCTLNMAVDPSGGTIRSIKLGERLAHDETDISTGPIGGYEDFTLTIASVGSEISGLVGKRAAFKIVGSGTEYFTAYVASATTLTNVRRGFFFNSSLAPVKPTYVSNTNTITLLKMGWLFLDVDGATTEAVYTEPIYATTQPAAPASGDYWYDFTNTVWKRYNGAAYVTVDRLLIGVFCSDATNTIGCRPVDFFASHKSDNTLRIEYNSASKVIANSIGAKITVFGNTYDFGNTRPIWDNITDIAPSSMCLEAGSGEQSNVYYFAYIKDTGVPVFSDMPPQWRPDLLGWYHRYAPWRAVGYIFNVSTTFSTTRIQNFSVNQYGWLSDTDIPLNGIKRTRLEAMGFAQSSAGTNTNSTGAFVSIAQVVHTATTGRAMICLAPIGTSDSYFQVNNTGAVQITLKRSSTVVAQWRFSAASGYAIPLNLFFIEAFPLVRGTSYTYDWGIESSSGTQINSAGDWKAFAFDIT